METSKEFEKVVSFIETVLKEKDDIKVLHNVSLKDRDGNNCQIDVLIENDLGSRLGKILIPVECKNWNTKRVERKDIGSFLELLDSLNVSKGIYVSKLGFQSAAIVKAKNSGKILLYTLQDSETKKIIDWIEIGPIIRYALVPVFESLSIEATVAETEKDDKVDFAKFKYEDTFITVNNAKTPLIEFFIHLHNSMSPEDFKKVLRAYKSREKNRSGGGALAGLEIGVINKELISVTFKDQTLPLHDLIFKYEARLIAEESTDFYYREYTDYFTEKVDAEVFTARFEGSKIDFVKGTDSSVHGFVSFDDIDTVTTVTNYGKIDED